MDDFLTSNELRVSDIMARISYIRWNGNVFRFILDQHAWLYFYSTISLKQQSTADKVAPLQNLILIPSQPVFPFTP